MGISRLSPPPHLSTLRTKQPPLPCAPTISVQPSLCAVSPSHCSSTSTISSASYFNTLAACIQPSQHLTTIANTFNMISTLVSMDITLSNDFLVSCTYLFHLNRTNPVVSSHALLSSVRDPPFSIYHVTPIFISPPARPYIARAAHKALDLYTTTQGFRSLSPFVRPRVTHDRGDFHFVW